MAWHPFIRRGLGCGNPRGSACPFQEHVAPVSAPFSFQSSVLLLQGLPVLRIPQCLRCARLLQTWALQFIQRVLTIGHRFMWNAYELRFQPDLWIESFSKSKAAAAVESADSGVPRQTVAVSFQTRSLPISWQVWRKLKLASRCGVTQLRACRCSQCWSVGRCYKYRTCHPGLLYRPLLDAQGLSPGLHFRHRHSSVPTILLWPKLAVVGPGPIGTTPAKISPMLWTDT